MGQDDGQELGGQLQQPSSRLGRVSRGWTRQEEGAQIVGDGKCLCCVFDAEARRRGLALTSRVDQCGELGGHTAQEYVGYEVGQG